MLDEKKTKKDKDFTTRVVHGYEGYDKNTGSVSFPIYQTATYRNPGILGDIEFSYTRCKNPTRQELENTIASLENGVSGFAFASGLAAVTACFSLLKSGDHVIVSNDIYGGTYRGIELIWKKFNVEFTYVDIADLISIKNACKSNTRMIFIETPTNPMMNVADIAGIAKIAKEIQAIFVVDNTFLTPYYQRPIELGADIVLHSATKFLAGHHDTSAGLLVLANDKYVDEINMILKTEGSGLSPFDSWLVLRGIKTLALRMDKHQQNALKVANWLKENKNVNKVFYVGLPEHPAYEITKKQCSGFGGMISFTIKDAKKVKDVLSGGEIIMFAESLGGCETLITYPLTQTHASIPKDQRDKLGITENLIRLSVGIESANDIIKDLEIMLK